MKKDKDFRKINEVLIDLHHAKLCLPEFQRDFVWKPAQVADLMMSIMREYPIGWLTFLDYKKNRYVDPRPIETIPLFDRNDCRYLVLDGQQRLTSLYKVFHAANKGIFDYRSKQYLLYIKIDNIAKEKMHDLKNKFIAVASFHNKESCEDYLANFDVQLKYHTLPLFVLLNKDAFRRWKRKANGVIRNRQINELELLRRRLINYKISFFVIRDKINTSALCNIFEVINNTGTKLNIFDLKVAEFEKFGVDLRKLWKEAKEIPVIRAFDIDPVYILRIIILLRKALGNPREIKNETCIEKDIDNLLALYNYKQFPFKRLFESDWRKAVKYLNYSLDYCRDNYGVDREGKNPYTPILIVYAAILWWADEIARVSPQELIKKLSLWYWRAVFSRRYEKGTNARISEDFTLLRKWISGKTKNLGLSRPKDNLKYSLMKRISSNRDAIYRAILCLPASNKGDDIWFKKGIKDAYVDDHHIFPKKWLEKNGFDIKNDVRVNCVLNRTYILKDAHKMGDKEPSKYFRELSDKIYTNQIDADTRGNLKKHFIDDEALQCIRKNRFRRFLKARSYLIEKEILNKISG